MIDIEERLRTSGATFHVAAAAVKVPEFEMPGGDGRQWRRHAGVGVAAVSVVAAGAAWMAHDRPHGVRASSSNDLPLPVAVVAGERGTEIPLVEVDDGDGDAATVLLRVGDTGRGVIIRPKEANTAITVPATAAPIGGVPTAGPVAPELMRCVELDTGEGACGPITTPIGTEMGVMLGDRRPEGAALVTYVPVDASVVVFESGDQWFWQRPLHGVAAFPFTDAAESEATVEALASDGTVVASNLATKSTPTTAELGARVTQPAGATPGGGVSG